MMRLHTGWTEKDLLPKIVTMIEGICVDAPEKTFLTPDQQSEESHLCTTTNREGVQLLLHNVQKNYCTMCKKKNYCTTCNSPILFITTSTGHHNQPQFSITTNGCHHFHQRKYSHNSRCRRDTQYTVHSIHQK